MAGRLLLEIVVLKNFLEYQQEHYLRHLEKLKTIKTNHHQKI